MLVFGTITAINENNCRCKILIETFDNYETDWIFIPQMSTVKDKSHNQYEIGTLVGAVMDDELQDGVIIGALYNDEDTVVIGNKDKKYIRFEDGSFVEYDKKEHKLTANIEGDIDITCKRADINCTSLNISANDTVEITAPNTKINGSLDVTGDIKSLLNVSDLCSSMQSMRSIYNEHLHLYQNIPTTNPDKEMN